MGMQGSSYRFILLNLFPSGNVQLSVELLFYLKLQKSNKLKMKCNKVIYVNYPSLVFTEQ